MGIASTHYITRNLAQQIISSKMLSLSDRQLEDMLETAVHNGFYNFSIVSEENIKELQTDEYKKDRCIISIFEIPPENDAY